MLKVAVKERILSAIFAHFVVSNSAFDVQCAMFDVPTDAYPTDKV